MRSVLTSFLGESPFDLQQKLCVRTLVTRAFVLVDLDVILKHEPRFETRHHSRERPVIPKFYFRFFRPPVSSCDRHRNCGGHRTDKRFKRKSVSELDLKMKVIADVRHRDHAYPEYHREFFDNAIYVSRVFGTSK